MALLENINPKLDRKCEEREITPEEEDNNVVDPFDSREIFGILGIQYCSILTVLIYAYIGPETSFSLQDLY